jgi:type III secretion protein D
MDALQQGVKRIRPDLPTNVKDIRIDATGAEQADAPAGASYIAIVSSDTVRYAQTPDGVKHIFILDNDMNASAPAAASAASDAATPAAADSPQPASDATPPVSKAVNELPSPLARQLAGPAAARHVLDLPQTSVAQTADTLRR